MSHHYTEFGESLGQVSDVKNKNRARCSRTVENISVVAEIVDDNTLELGNPQTSSHRILQELKQ